MSLRGSLNDLPLPDLLQIVSLNRKTGRLRVTATQGDGLFVFRDGKIIYGATSSHRESFGSVLVLRGLITPEQLGEAIDLKARSLVDRRLGFVLLEMGAVNEAQLQEVLAEQVREVAVEMVGWRHGVVEFEEIDIAPQGEVAVDAQDFVMRDGVSASGVMLALVDARRGDELTETQQFLAALDWTGDPQPRRPGKLRSGSLNQVIGAFQPPVWPGEVALDILRNGADIVSRGVLLLRAADGFRGLGQFGIWEGEEAVRVRGLRMPHSGDSLLGEVARSRRGFRGAPDSRPHNLLFFRFLESDPPPEAIVLPVLADGEVQLLFYGDNLPSAEPIPDSARFEQFLADIGRTMERSRS